MQIEDSTSGSEEKNGLTDLLRRESFMRRVFPDFNDGIERREPYYSFVMVDTDDFKAFNDLDSTTQGDYVLIGVGDVLKTLHERGVVQYLSCRYGGEEFMVALHGANAEQANGIAESIRECIKSYRFIDARTETPDFAKQVTASIGVATADLSRLRDLDPEQRRRALDSILDEADTAMKYAKFMGKDRVECFSGEVNDEMEKIKLVRKLYFECAASPEKAAQVASHQFMQENPDLKEKFLFHCEFASRELTPSDTRIIARLADNFYSSIYNDSERKSGFLGLISGIH